MRQQKRCGQIVHALTVANLWIAAGVSEEYFLKLLYTRTSTEEDVVGKGAGDVHLDLRCNGRVILAIVHQVFIVAWHTQMQRTASLGPDGGSHIDGYATQNKATEFQPLGTPDLAFVTQACDAYQLTIGKKLFRHCISFAILADTGNVAFALVLRTYFSQKVVPLDSPFSLKIVV